MAEWERYLDEHQSRFVDELLDFLRIPSISSLSKHTDDVKRAARWVADRMEAAGIEGVRILPTEGEPGHPVVYGEWLHAPGKPTIMIYGHFDIQPVDPLELWAHPPFEPVIEAGRIYARGACDDKGNLLIPILAVEALIKASGSAPVNLKFFFEGQEEIGSPNLPPFLPVHREQLACDLILSADGRQWSEDKPMISLGSRGLCAIQIDLRGANRDLHSGSYGGAVQNSSHALAQLLVSMRSPDGQILVKGFYDNVVPLTDADRALIASAPFDEADYKKNLGLDEVFGEPGFTTLERNWARPTLEVNGIWSGFQGEGIKTVLPAEAHAKITCRLVPDQDPYKIVELLAAHVETQALVGVTVTCNQQSFMAYPYKMPTDHPGNQAAYTVLEALYGVPPIYTRVGGTIPVVALFLKHLGVYTTNFSFGAGDEPTHAPNEFFRLSSFARGQKAYGKLLEQLSHPEGWSTTPR